MSRKQWTPEMRQAARDRALARGFGKKKPDAPQPTVAKPEPVQARVNEIKGQPPNLFSGFVRASHSQDRNEALSALIFLHGSETQTGICVRFRGLDADTDSRKHC